MSIKTKHQPDSNMKRKIVQRIVERCKAEGKRANDIVKELKRAGYEVFVASFCYCEGVVFFNTHDSLEVRLIPN